MELEEALFHGSPRTDLSIDDAHFHTFHKNGVELTKETPGTYFDRAIIRGALIQGTTFKRQELRSSCAVILKNISIFEVESFAMVFEKSYRVGRFY